MRQCQEPSIACLKIFLLYHFSRFSFTSLLGFCIWEQNRQLGAERWRKFQERWSPGKVWHFRHPVLSEWPLIFENGKCRLCHNAGLLDPVHRWRELLLRSHIWKEEGWVIKRNVDDWFRSSPSAIHSLWELGWKHWGVQYRSDMPQGKFYPYYNQADDMPLAFYLRLNNDRSFALNCFQLAYSAISQK